MQQGARAGQVLRHRAPGRFRVPVEDGVDRVVVVSDHYDAETVLELTRLLRDRSVGLSLVPSVASAPFTPATTAVCAVASTASATPIACVFVGSPDSDAVTFTST